jgi:predicted nucleic acid-binding protein
MRTTFDDHELPVTGDTAEEYAKFRRRLFVTFDKKGKYTENREDHLGTKVGVDENDLWLVAQACERNLTFVTHDKMKNINAIVQGDVRIVNWPDK